MTISKFMLQLLITIGISFFLVGIINYLLGDNGDWSISFIGIAFYSIFSILMFFLGILTMRSQRKYQYIRLVIANTMAKIFLSFITVGFYFEIGKPHSKFFILPFLAIYLVFTVFETNFMLKQSDQKK